MIAHDQCTYDAFGSLLSEIQSHGEFPGSGYIPTINYSWTYAPAQDGTLQVQPRLAWMQYPTPPNGSSGARKVLLGYGTSSATADSILSRITQFSTALGTGTSSGAAGLSYVGTSRRSKVTQAESTTGTGLIVTDFDAGGSLGLENLDGFGRPKNLAAMRGSTTLFSAEYTYDAAGNRTTAKLTQASEGAQTQVNKRSQINAYDSLRRLAGTQVGQLDFDGNGVPSIHTGTSIRSDLWWMDAIGNFNGGYRTGNPYGRDGTAAIDLAGHTAVRYATNKRNEITSATYRTGSNGTELVGFAYDKAGNLIFDGSYYYQYDAWNRLVQINPATPIAPQQGFVPGNPEDEPVSFTVSSTVIKHFVYDGAGRLIQTQSPYPNPQATTGLVRLERYFYDGVRRIQEVNSDGVTTLNNASSGDSQTQQAASQSTAAQGSTNVSGGTSPTGLANVVIRVHPQGTYLNHEYIWGPGDRGIDELLVEYDFGRKAWYALVDGGGDVVALCDKSGSGVSSNATVGAQWTYDAYGNVVTAWVRDTDVPASFVGHKGLFAERLDVGVATSTSGYDSARLSPMATVLYHNRNRAYSPVLGRFIERDPNSSGLLCQGLVYHGQSAWHDPGSPSLEGALRDGANLSAYLGNSPWGQYDPTGLSLGLLPLDTMNDTLKLLSGRASMGALDMIRYHMMLNMARYYAAGAAAANGILADSMGTPGVFGADDLVMVTSRLAGAGPKAAHFLEMTGANFRYNLQVLTGFTGRTKGVLWEAHHLIPKEFASIFQKFGINVHNPLFGNWIVDDLHRLLHKDGYNLAWHDFINTLERLHKSGQIQAPGTALEMTVKFIREELGPRFGVQIAI